MAIVIEEEKKPVNWVAIASTAIFIVILFAGSYFLFFKKPEIVEEVVPKPLQDLSQISQLSFDPGAVLNSSKFKLLRQYTPEISAPTPGRSNPFKPF
jgi:hypothetical protein